MSHFERERRRWEASERAKRKEEEVAFHRQLLIKSILGKFDYLVIAILAFNLALTFDYYFPKKTFEDELLKLDNLYYRESIFGGDVYPYTRLIFYNGSLLMNRSVPIPVVFGTPAKISSTLIFSIETAVEINPDGKKYVFDNLDNFYSNAGNLIWIILLTIALYQFVFVIPDHKLSFALLLLTLFIFEVVAFLRFA